MNVEQALTIADTLDASEPAQHRALGALAAEVRCLREQENLHRQDCDSLLRLVAEIRSAIGDPTGRLMQDELIQRCGNLREREAKARKLIAVLIQLYEADCDLDRAVDDLNHWLKTE